MEKPQPQKQREITAQFKLLLAALIGAVVGSGASLHTYHTVLGGADQARRIAQIEAAVEQSSNVSDEILTLLKSMESENAELALSAGDKISKKPTQRELTDAIDGLFEGLGEGDAETTEPAVDPAPASDNAQQADPVSASSEVSDGDSKIASNEASGA